MRAPGTGAQHSRPHFHVVRDLLRDGADLLGEFACWREHNGTWPPWAAHEIFLLLLPLQLLHNRHEVRERLARARVRGNQHVFAR